MILKATSVLAIAWMVEAVVAQAIAPPAAREMPWTPAMVAALFAGMAVLIAAVGNLIVQLRSTQRIAGRAVDAAEAGHAATLESRGIGANAKAYSDRKLDHIETNVNGDMAKALAKIERLEKQNSTLIEMLTKTPGAPDPPAPSGQ